MKIPIFPSKYHQNSELSMAMLVYRSVGGEKRGYPFAHLLMAGPILVVPWQKETTL